MKREAVASVGEAARNTAPPVTVSAFSLLGIPLNEWVYIITIVWILYQFLRSIPKTFGCIQCFYKHRRCTLHCKGDYHG